MNEENPFSAELVDAASPHDAREGAVLREGKLLVVPRRSPRFPPRCLKSNREWRGEKTTMRVYPTLGDLTRARLAEEVGLPLDPQWLIARRNRCRRCVAVLIGGLLAFVLGVVAYVVALTSGLARQSSADWLMPVIFLSPFVSLAGLAWRAFVIGEPFALRRATTTHIWLAGVHPDLLASLPQWQPRQ